MSDMNSYVLSQVGYIVTGNTPDTKDDKYWNGDIPFYSPGDFSSGVYCQHSERTITRKALVGSRLIPENSIMVTCIGSIGKMSINRQSGVTNQQINSLIPFKNFEYRYVYYLILNNIEKLQNSAPQTTIPILNKTEFGKFSFKFHKLPEQRKIAEILTAIDQTIEKTEELISKFQQIKIGVMQDLFASGIGSDGKLRPPREQAPELYHKTKIGWIPKDWQATKLKDILLRTGGYLQTGPFGSQLHAHEYTYEGVPVVMPQDIDNGLVHEEQISRITEYRANTLIRHRLKVGDIIIARRGELSRSAAITEVEKGWVCGTGCFLMRLGHSKLNSTFLSHVYRHSMIQRQVEGLAVGSTMPSLNNGIMGNLIFPDIDPREQFAISDKIQITEEKVTTLQAERSKLVFLKSGLMCDLLTGKKSVSIDAAETSCV
jgi:type I restriction enzyme S subunit